MLNTRLQTDSSGDSRRMGRTLILFLLFIAACVQLGAQSTFGSLVGTVHDPSGAVVPDCITKITNTGTGGQRSMLTDKEGNFVFVNLEPGTYDVEFLAPGFQVANVKGVLLTARQTLRVDGNMSIAGVSESINVEATATAVIETEVSSISDTKTGKELMTLPVAIGSRAAGSTSAMSTLTKQVGVQTDNGGNLSIAGSKPSMLSVTIDGLSTMSARTSGAIAELFPSFGAIAEIRVSEINNTAEFGGVSDVTTVSKGGANAYHGGLFENLQNTALNARNPFSSAVTKTQMNNYGAFLGGRIIRNRTFFFTSYEGLQLPRQQFIAQSVPSLALRGGDLSAYSGNILDPSTGTPFLNKQIPLTRISPAALAALQYLFPLPNTGAPNAIANNYSVNFSTPISSNQGDLRIDHTINSRQSFFVRGTYKSRDVVNPPASSGTVLAGPVRQPELDYSVGAAYNFIFTPTLVNELRLGFSGQRIFTSTDADARKLVSLIGIPVPDAPGGNATPTFTINGFQPTSSTSSSVSRGRTLQLLDNLTWNHGSHTVKFGGDVRRLTYYYSNAFASTRVGSYTFNGALTNSIVGNPYAAFLLGIPDITKVSIVNAPDMNSFTTHLAGYVQDDWKVTSRLTLNFGLRWEFHPSLTDKLHNLAIFDPSTTSVINGVTVRGTVIVPDKGYSLVNDVFARSIAPTPIVKASQMGLGPNLHKAQLTSFAPRVGFAWRPFANGKTVIRGGYGKYIETLLGTLSIAAGAVSASTVGNYTNTLVNGAPALTLAKPFPADLAQPGIQTFQVNSAIKYRDPYVQQWNFTIERDLGFNTGLRLSYDGNHGSQLGYQGNIAQIPANTLGYAASKSASPFPLWSSLNTDLNGARSNYHAFTAVGTKRMSNGLQFSSSYSFAKNLSNGQGYNPTAFASQAGGGATDAYNLDLDYGNVSFSRRHRFLTTFLYDLPVGKGKAFLGNTNSVLDKVVGGWQVSGVYLVQSGPFMTVVVAGADPAGNGFPTLVGNGRADRVSGVSVVPVNQNINNWINVAAFAKPPNNVGRGPTSSVGSVVGPASNVLSLSLFKSVVVRENLTLQIGAAASNALNHPNYALPNLTFGTAAFGTINNVQSQEDGGPRSLQLTMRLMF